MWDVILDNLPAIITLALGLTVVWKWADKLLVVAKETQELMVVFISALADKKLTQKEIDSILKEAKDVGKAVKNLLSKKK